MRYVTTFNVIAQTAPSTKVPTAADSNAVTYRIYGPSGGTALLTGSFSTTVVDSQTGWYISGNLAITGANGFAAGNTYRVRVAYAIASVNIVDTYSFAVT